MRFIRPVLVSGAAVFALMLSVSISGSADDAVKHIGNGVETLPLFDAHVHYKEPAWGPFPPATVVELMDRSGVAMALVSSTPDEGTIKLWEYAPNRVVPELRPYHGQAGSSNWTKAPGMFDYLVKRLSKYPHRALASFTCTASIPAMSPCCGKSLNWPTQRTSMYMFTPERNR